MTTASTGYAYSVNWMMLRKAVLTEIAIRDTSQAQAAREIGFNPAAFSSWLKGGTETGTTAAGFASIVKWIGTGFEEFLTSNAPAPTKGRKASKHALELTRLVSDQMLPGEDALQAAARLLRDKSGSSEVAQ